MPPRKKRREALQPTRSFQPAPGAPTFEIPADTDTTNLRCTSYEIAYEPMPQVPSEWPTALNDQAEELYDLVHEKPDAAVARLEPLVRQYPDFPRLLNFLMMAHDMAGRNDKARQLAAESYQRFPDYLFGKMTYVNMLLSERKTEEAAAILDKKFDLKLLYPERSCFHITEVLTFAMTAGWYFAQKGDIEVAERLHKTMVRLAPDAPQTAQLAAIIQTETLIGDLNKIIAMGGRGKRTK